MKQSHRWIGLIFSCALVVAFGGCGSDEPSLTLAGQITRNGQPLAVAADEYCSLNFYALEPDGSLGVNSFSGSVQSDGTYVAAIEEGTYRISFQLMKKADHKDLLGGKYAQAESALTNKEVTGSEDDFTIAIED